MKKVLSLLVAFVFLQTQSWALSGGPQFGLDQFSIMGTYAGVLVPVTATLANSIVTTSAASIGLFSIVVPTEGVAKGASITFIGGTAYSGNINAIADPLTSTITGVIEGSSNYDVIAVVDGVQITTKIFAQGSLKATAFQQFATSGYGQNGGTRLTGKAFVDLFSSLNANGPIVSNSVIFEVDGFKQSSATTTINASQFDFGN